MPKFVRKSCSAQSTISAYFGSKSRESSTGSNDKHTDHTDPQTRTGKNQHKRPSSSSSSSSSFFFTKSDSNNKGAEGAPSKRPKLSSRKHEEKSTSAGGKCHSDGAIRTSTLEKLRGFSCDDAAAVLEKDHEISTFLQTKQSNTDHTDLTEDTEDAEDDDTSLVQPSFSQFARPGLDRKGPVPVPLPVPCASPSRRPRPVLTPLEQQVTELQQRHPGVLLAIECGYKYRFFGEDAEASPQTTRR
ncbi:unnamed protein product [Knipowitschia caucasica]|uniref:DNA mismatch repair protein MutS-like N-terminal domain-containing protein n=1 Tax=Knipowitschia caucasica TaxID=637954 RepID=A0AAV2MNF5_KNICA